MKRIYLGLLVIAAVFLMSYSPESPIRVTVGGLAPGIALQSGNSVISLKDCRGKYVLLNFWSKSEPTSRIDNHFYDKIISGSRSGKVVYISICADSGDEKLSRLILECDGNNTSTQYMLSQTVKTDCSPLYIKEGLATWLISPQGMIIAKNPSQEVISGLTTA